MNWRGDVKFSLSHITFWLLLPVCAGFPLLGNACTYTSVQDGTANDAATWVTTPDDGDVCKNTPPNPSGNDTMIINHIVIGETAKINMGEGTLIIINPDGRLGLKNGMDGSDSTTAKIVVAGVLATDFSGNGIIAPGGGIEFDGGFVSVCDGPFLVNEVIGVGFPSITGSGGVYTEDGDIRNGGTGNWDAWTESPGQRPSGVAACANNLASVVAGDGVIEDCDPFPAGAGLVPGAGCYDSALPVTLNAFHSERDGAENLEVSWQTSSETNTAGFRVFGRINGHWSPLSDIVESKGMDSPLPQTYSVSVPGQMVTELAIEEYDTRGKSNLFGPYEPGRTDGEFQAVETINWDKIHRWSDQRMVERGFSRFENNSALIPHRSFDDVRESDYALGIKIPSDRWRNLVAHSAMPKVVAGRESRDGVSHIEANGGGKKKKPTPEAPPQSHIEVVTPGIQRVSYETLRDGGLDLFGVSKAEIAVSFRGDPVARHISGSAGEVFGPGDYLEFLGRTPEGEDAFYIDTYLYQVEVNSQKAKESAIATGSSSEYPEYFWHTDTIDRQIQFRAQSRTGDAWVETSKLVRSGGWTWLSAFNISRAAGAGMATLQVHLGFQTDLRDIWDDQGNLVPEHNVELWFGDDPVLVGQASANGYQRVVLKAEVPTSMLREGEVPFELRFNTDYLYSSVYIDRYSITYPTSFNGPQLDFAMAAEDGGYRIEGVDAELMVAYAELEEGGLTRLAPIFAGDLAFIPQVASAGRVWVTESPAEPNVFSTVVADTQYGGPADLVIITAPEFVGTPALDEYLTQKKEDGLKTAVIDTETIFNTKGFGMAVPQAITNYLAERDEVRPFSMVQLVGADCYDHHNRVSSCISFIPLPTAEVGVTQFGPSQNRLLDLDRDGVADKAVAQFSVRDESELGIIVQKSDDWRVKRESGGLVSALLISETGDGLNDFRSQIDRVGERLTLVEDLSVIDLADYAYENGILDARSELRDQLGAGQDLTVYSGHAGYSWLAYQGLVLASKVSQELDNAGLPTLMVPLTCQVSYDSSPSALVLGHQLLYAGDFGAVTISGGASLTRLDHNETMVNHVIAGLEQGLSIGEAVQLGRESIGRSNPDLQNNWVTQGDVATRLVH